MKVVGTQCDQCYPDFVEKTRERVKEQLEAQVRAWEEKITGEVIKIGQVLKVGCV